MKNPLIRRNCAKLASRLDLDYSHGMITYPARYWHMSSRRDAIVCTCCPRECELRDGQRGFCFSRRNEGGKLDLEAYGRVIGLCVDPIEKKPLNHFFPGTGVLSFGTAGCNLGCRFCQNWSMSKARDYSQASSRVAPEDIVRKALETGCRSVAFTYNDPTIFTEYAIDVAIACREAGLRTVAVTAGFIGEEARHDLYAHLDAINVDLKAFTDEFYDSICLGGHLDPVLDTLRYIRRETKAWLEITTLLIPGENDGQGELQELSDWVLSELGPDVPLHFTAFHPDFKMRDRPRTPHSTLSMAREIAKSSGLHHVYVGNVKDRDAGSTWCHACGMLLIERDGYRILQYNLTDNDCSGCGTAIEGVFDADVPRNDEPRRFRVSLD